jgi:hypothetical protein
MPMLLKGTAELGVELSQLGRIGAADDQEFELHLFKV